MLPVSSSSNISSSISYVKSALFNSKLLISMKKSFGLNFVFFMFGFELILFILFSLFIFIFFPFSCSFLISLFLAC